MNQTMITPPDPLSAAAEPPRPVARTRGRPTREEGEALRQSILDAALQLFIARGLKAASMEGIAREAGVAKITLYRHYETKEQLFVEVARRAQLSVRARLGTMADADVPLETALRAIITKLYDGYTHPDYLAVMRMVIAEAGRFPKLGRAMLEDAQHISEPLVAYLQALKDKGLVDIDSPYDAAVQISGMASGAGRYLLLTPSRHPASRKRWVESLVSLFVKAWRMPKS
ncbi:TetR/AcrR family transcriptional regulator [Nevskia ramosa]|uniref:TetR/AcrR family transcriptional regulator n=1 Tax=Nevskia ramosa TaxID=64002 RepID=UPI0003F7BECB|nr:TetR/AcrR family transcriptional regulator [Nevskia ramosa]